MIINEVTRFDLLKNSKTPGYDRYNKRRQVDKSEIKIDKLITAPLNNRSDVDIYIKVKDYQITLRILNFFVRVRKYYQRTKYRNDIRKLLELALRDSLNNNDILVNCTCPDYYYRFSYTATVKGYAYNKQYMPSLVRNPKNEGSVCKHLAKILSAPSIWRSRVVTQILDYVKKNPSILETY